jgi:hypothetical protein
MSNINNLPQKKAGWDHSEQVLVYYEASPEIGQTSKYSIAYYHYNPPFDGPHWTDFNTYGRIPSQWWELPKPDKE